MIAHFSGDSDVNKRDGLMSMMFQIPNHIWIEMGDTPEADACDVLVQMDDGNLYTAMFVTLPYLRRQMDLSYEVSKQLPDALPVRYTALETPHILVESLDRDTIEDTIDNLLTLEIFENLFTKVSAKDEEEARKLATTEVAAVVLSEVLIVEGDAVITVA
jgi:hypothetical protein